MDLESLKGLGWLLLWGALFFIMMRYGCGAHMMGGHRHGARAGPEGPASGGETKDPVCGMGVDPKSAAAASVHGGRTFYFCSASCRDRFEKAPEKYADEAQGGHQHG